MRVALVQTNPVIGDVDGNTAAILRGIDAARTAGAALAIFCEQAIIGYPAKDLLLRRELIDRNVAALQHIARHADTLGVIVGYAEPNPAASGRPLFNTAALLHRGQVVDQWRKRLLPTYDVFDEARYFEAAGPQAVVEFNGTRLGVSICEDLLAESLCGRPLYADDPVADLVAGGSELLINISASPFTLSKQTWRERVFAETTTKHRRPLIYVNQVGGNDDLLFDGASCVAAPNGGIVARAASFREDTLIIETDQPGGNATALPQRMESLHDALVMGLRDYLRKCGFSKAVLGLSGGIDSAVTAALATTALGADSVHGVAMPSRYSSEHSVTDARTLAENLGIGFSIIEIEPIHRAYEEQLAPHFAGREPDVTEENIQARVRGNLLMAFSNKFGNLLLTTGNKSEIAVGYCTLYGDMSGGLAVISDVPKTMVYDLGRYINERAGRAVIPESTLTKPPSAELRPDQTDQDSLPSYDVLDEVLARYEERLEDREQIVAAGIDPEVAARAIRLFQTSEYKRQQMPPGLKVTTRAFGFGRRMPIAARPPR